MTDTEIIALYWNRDETAIEATSQKYGPYCFTIARHILGSEEDARECVNDTWLGAWQTIPPQRPGCLSAFLAKITRNLSFDRYRAANAQKRGGGETALALDELIDCIPAAASPEQDVEEKVLASSINAFLARLPERERNIFVRRYWAVETISEIAARYGMKEGSVRTSLFRCRGRLKAHLEKEGILSC